jgi:hypothetical protein
MASQRFAENCDNLLPLEGEKNIGAKIMLMDFVRGCQG